MESSMPEAAASCREGLVKGRPAMRTTVVSNLGPETDFQAPWEVPNLLETGAATMLQIDQTGSYSCLGKSTEN